MVVLRVGLEVLGQIADAIAEKRDLDFRGACIAVVGFVRADDLGLAVLGKRHLSSSTHGPEAGIRTRPPYTRYVAKLPSSKDLLSYTAAPGHRNRTRG